MRYRCHGLQCTLFDRRREERIAQAWVEEVHQRVEAGRDFQEAVREVFTANAELLILARKQESRHRR